jgi:lipopolysaccharide transport system ATP-binding protein
VSHNMQALSSFCKNGIYLKDGKVEMIGEITRSIDHYLNASTKLNSFTEYILSQAVKMPDPDFKLNNIVFYQDSREVSGNVVNGKEIKIEIHYELLNRLNRFRVFLDVCDQLGSVIFRTFHDENSTERLNLEKGSYKSLVTVPANFLAPISYDFRFLFGVHNVRMMQPMDGVLLRINVEQTGLYNKAYNGQYTSGMICPLMHWEISQV